MLIADHLLEQDLFKAAEIGLGEGNSCCFEMFGEFWRCAVVGSDWDGLVVSSENDGRGSIVVDVRIVGVADPQQVGGYSEWHFFALIDEGDAFAAGDVYGAVEAVDNIERAHWRVDEYLWIFAANNAQIFVLDLLLDCDNVAESLQTHQLCIFIEIPCSVMVMRGTMWSLIVEAFSFWDLLKMGK